MRLRLFTNESFDNYFCGQSSRRRLFEDRWDSLDFDDADIDIPSQGEVEDSVRELDLVDDIAAKTGAGDIKVGGDGKIRLIDLDDKGKKVRNADDDSSSSRDIDFDDVGNDVKDIKSNVGAIGSLDYDDDVDTSTVAASIDDVYTALASDKPETVKAIIKRYAGDIKDTERLKEAMLIQAMKLNLDCLRVLCGDMKVDLNSKEKELDYIDKDAIKSLLDKLKSIAPKLTGANNTYGLIPNAIAQCGPDKQQQAKCKKIIEYLTNNFGLPIEPVYFRGAIVKKCYDVAEYLYNKLPKDFIDKKLLVGPKGLLPRIKNSKIPDSLLGHIVDAALEKGMSSSIIGDLIVLALTRGNTKIYNKLLKDIDFNSNKGDLIFDYIVDNYNIDNDLLEPIGDTVVDNDMSSDIIGEVLVTALKNKNTKVVNKMMKKIDFDSDKGKRVTKYVRDFYDENF